MSHGAEGDVPLAEGCLVIGDLHLAPSGGPSVDSFVAWLDGLRDVSRLVIVGDLFDAWIGPEQIRLAGTRPVLDALKRLTWRGVPVDVLHGNRDFMLGEFFEAWTGARVWPDGLVGALPGGQRVLVIHGDELCTRDRSYQRLKAVLRGRWTRALLTRLPFFLKRRLAQGLREASRKAVPAKPSGDKAMQEDACRALATRHEAALVLCGHAHRFRDEQLDGGPRWLVIDGFGGERDGFIVRQGTLEAVASRSNAAQLRLV